MNAKKAKALRREILNSQAHETDYQAMTVLSESGRHHIVSLKPYCGRALYQSAKKGAKS